MKLLMHPIHSTNVYPVSSNASLKVLYSSVYKLMMWYSHPGNKGYVCYIASLWFNPDSLDESVSFYFKVIFITCVFIS